MTDRLPAPYDWKRIWQLAVLKMIFGHPKIFMTNSLQFLRPSSNWRHHRKFLLRVETPKQFDRWYLIRIGSQKNRFVISIRKAYESNGDIDVCLLLYVLWKWLPAYLAGDHGRSELAESHMDTHLFLSRNKRLMSQPFGL